MTVRAATVEEVIDGIAAALEPLTNEIPGLQIVAGANSFPTPPSIDIYPGDPFLEGAGFGVRDWQSYYTIRARVSTVDQRAGQRLLWRLLDPNDPASVLSALLENGEAQFGSGGAVTGYREYVEDSVQNGRLLGCEWRVSVFL